MGDVRIGTSGWSYPSGPGTWNGIFYPAVRAARARKFDELAFYADHFDTVEVNASFYRVPTPEMTRSWAARTPGHFDFALKLHQKFTHPAMYERALRPGAMPDHERSPVPTVGLNDVEAFKAAIDPLAEAGKLGPLLVQFPPSFRANDETAGYVAWLLQVFAGYRLAVELRHRSWSDAAPRTLEQLVSGGAAWVQIDEPKFRSSIRQDLLPNVRGVYYLRLHGRNAEKWWTHDHQDERYNYLYSPDELSTFTDTVQNVRRLVQQIYVFMNNHFAAKAVANAAMLRHALEQPTPGEYAPQMIDRYPCLKEYVREAPGRSAGELFDGPNADEMPAGGAESPEE